MSKTMGSNRPSAWSKMELKRRVFVFSEEESSMEEEWMRDRALLRDLLNKDPQTPPQELARAIGRSVSWIKKWRKRLREGDPHDQELWCSRSRAHHAPYFRLRPARGNRYGGNASVGDRRIWDARQVPEACSIICRAIQSGQPH